MSQSERTSSAAKKLPEPSVPHEYVKKGAGGTTSAASLRWRLRYAWWGVRDHLRGWWRHAKETTLDG